MIIPAVRRNWIEPFKDIAQQSRPEVEEQNELPHFKGTSSPQELSPDVSLCDCHIVIKLSECSL